MEENNKNNKEPAGKNMPGVRNRITRAVVLLILVIAALSGSDGIVSCGGCITAFMGADSCAYG